MRRNTSRVLRPGNGRHRTGGPRKQEALRPPRSPDRAVPKPKRSPRPRPRPPRRGPGHDRLHYVVPFNSRRALRDTTIPSGRGPDGTMLVFIPAGQEVNFSTHFLHRRHDIWGPDADEFIPERWQGKGSGWAYMPFNGGPRICIGQQFALTEAGYVISRMLQRLDKIEGLDVDPPRDWHHFTIVCSPGPGHDSIKARLWMAQD